MLPAHTSHAERLGLELLLDGVAAQPGSRALNHMTLSGAENGALTLTDRITGTTHRVTADVVVNAAGAWIDKAGAALGLATRYIGGNKGSHLIVHNPALLKALDGAIGAMKQDGTLDKVSAKWLGKPLDPKDLAD